MKTFIPKIDPNARRWHVVDLKGATLGRAAVVVADLLSGKASPVYTPHIDTGDHVIAINCRDMKVSGNKLRDKEYYRYSGYPGGLYSRTLAQEMDKHPERVFERTVRGMLPKSRLGRKMLKKLHCYAGAEHPHQAQKPEMKELK